MGTKEPWSVPAVFSSLSPRPRCLLSGEEGEALGMVGRAQTQSWPLPFVPVGAETWLLCAPSRGGRHPDWRLERAKGCPFHLPALCALPALSRLPSSPVRWMMAK